MYYSSVFLGIIFSMNNKVIYFHGSWLLLWSVLFLISTEVTSNNYITILLIFFTDLFPTVDYIAYCQYLCGI